MTSIFHAVDRGGIAVIAVAAALLVLASATSARPTMSGHGIVRIRDGGTINGQTVRAGAGVSVAPGERIQGRVPVRVFNPYGRGPVFPVGATATWGDRRTQPWVVSRHVGPGWSDLVLQVDKSAPETPGRYHIVIGCAPRYNVHQVLSATTAARSAVWHDGNDLGWDWDESTFEQAARDGVVLTRVRKGDGRFSPGSKAGATAIAIDVRGHGAGDDRNAHTTGTERRTARSSAPTPDAERRARGPGRASRATGDSRRSANTWCAGTWDASLYAWSDPVHPRTVGVRVEIVDGRTRQPVDGAVVTLDGDYVSEWLGRLPDLSTPRVQTRHYELTARTGPDGVAVFGLSWRKEYPWSQERPLVRDTDVVGDSLNHARSWRRPVDDIEKVRVIEVRHPRYNARDVPFDFGHLLEFGQDPTTEYQEPERFERFERAWRNEIGRDGVLFCALRFGRGFAASGDQRSRDPALFENILREEYGYVYETPENLTSLRRNECAGPYLVYHVEVTLDPARREIEIVRDGEPARQAEPERQVDSSRQEAERAARAAEARARADAERRQREEAARQAEEARRREEARRARADARAERLRAEASEHPLGIAVTTLSDRRRKKLGLYLGVTGAVIEYVDSGSPAARAGLKEGEVIAAIEHRVVTDKADFRDHTADLDQGAQVTVEFWRKNRDGKWERERRTVTTR